MNVPVPRREGSTVPGQIGECELHELCMTDGKLKQLLDKADKQALQVV